MMIDAHEWRDVAITDVASAFLKAKMDDFVLVKLVGKEVDIMCDVNPNYKQYVATHEKGQKVLYLQLIQALYGCIKSALLWYETFASCLKTIGYS